MRIIPAIDIIGGKCVRLTRGDFSSKKEYRGDPVDTAKMFEDAGLEYLHFVDLDGAREGRVVNYRVLEKIAVTTSLIIDFGGGIRTDDDVRIAFECGASQVNCGSLAVLNREMFLEWLKKHGTERIILSADTRNRKVCVEGWTSEKDEDIIDFISRYSLEGVSYVVCTDIERDGMLEGPAIELYKDILSKCKINLIASGGIRSVNDLYRLSETGCEGAILGKAIYEGYIQLKDLAELC
ncbi:MAG TPA: 1-(5-phosphoribosyl)-5-[(5-phosphoribosylamino)methylideneamino]imidazole-4-carboxamide isomerase [Bacteroidales bacterium]|nr:1-(5-phosphoribosyl)-5-[(5-phosphoribosylamino)methylideneamino]imidazole-4-carboxamide isomerase [Bacteroidales bacterium]